MVMEMEESYLKLIILLPLLGAAIIGIGGFINEGFRKSEALIGWLGTGMVAIPFFIILAVAVPIFKIYAIIFDCA